MSDVRNRTYRYGPVNQCIYCGTEDGTLSGEHILAAALGGNIEILRASCLECQEIINKSIENPVLSKMLRDIRYKRKTGLRRRKTRPRTTRILTFSEHVDTDYISSEIMQKASYIEMEYETCPILTVWPIFREPRILQKLPHSINFSQHLIALQHYVDSSSLHGARSSMLYKQQVNFALLMRMLAKTAHGFSVLHFWAERV